MVSIEFLRPTAGHASPHNTLTMTEVMLEIRRDWGRPPDRKAPATDDQIKKMVDAVEPESAKGLRDRALLLFGFAGAFRRSELVALSTWNLEYRNE